MTPDAKREAVSYLQAAYGVSERRACAAMAADRSTIRCESKRLDDRELQALCEQRGYPKTIVSDNGTELTSTAVLKWVQETGVDWH